MSEWVEVSRISYDHDQVVVVIRLQRAAKKNALTQAMYAAMTAALNAAEADPKVAAVCFRGSADSFTAGNDLHDFLAMDGIDASAPVFQFLQAVATTSVPLVAEVNGLAIGIGTTLLLHCDFVLAAESAKFAMPFIKLGLVPEAASSLLLPRQIGHLAAAELLLLGDSFGAERAQELGLVSSVHSLASLPTVTEQLLAQLAQRPVTGLRQSKALLKANDEPVTARIQREIEVFAEALASPAAKAAIQATLQKK